MDSTPPDWGSYFEPVRYRGLKHITTTFKIHDVYVKSKQTGAYTRDIKGFIPPKIVMHRTLKGQDS